MKYRIWHILPWISALTVMAMSLAILLCSRPGAYFLITLLELPISALSSPINKQAQAIVVLGGGSGRELYGGHLQRETGLPLLLSGVEAPTMKSKIMLDSPSHVLWVEDMSKNTEENAKFSAKILHEIGVRHILLVTGSHHMFRARLIFRHHGFEVTAAPFSRTKYTHFSLYDFIPSTDGWRHSRSARREILGIAWFKIRHLL